MKIKDSLSGLLKPISVPHVTIYACGITPYSSAHVGHARTYVVFDLLARALRAQGHSVDLARNITDIDDKIIAAAEREGSTWQEIASRYAQENRELMLATGLPVPLEPKASEHLPEIFALTEALISKGLAYVSETGDVLYRVSAYRGQHLMPHREGALRSESGHGRITDVGKEDARDFALWKSMPKTAVGFDSPWGWGRPGWHIECSAMIGKMFAGNVVVHGGGVDLKFPHHEAEIMQSEPVFGVPVADIWMHNGSVLSDGQKMSKSLNNFVTWQAALDQADQLAPRLGGDLLRLSLLQTHWQKPLDWTNALLETTRNEIVSFSVGATSSSHVTASDRAAFFEQVNSNLNTPAMWVWLRAQLKAGAYGRLRAGLEFLGVDILSWAALIEVAASQPTETPEVIELQRRRNEARAQKDWALADQLRDQLKALGASVSDVRA